MINLNTHAAYQSILGEFKEKCVRLLEELPETFDKDPRDILVELAGDLKTETDSEVYREDLLTFAAFAFIMVLTADRAEAKEHLRKLKDAKHKA